MATTASTNAFDLMASDELNFDSFLDEVTNTSAVATEPLVASPKQFLIMDSNNNNTTQLSPHSMTSEEEEIVDVLNINNNNIAAVSSDDQIMYNDSFKTFDLNAFTQQLQQQFNVNNNAQQNTAQQQFDVSMFEQFFRQQQEQQLLQQQQPHQHASVVVDQQPAVIFSAPPSAFAQNNALAAVATPAEAVKQETASGAAKKPAKKQRATTKRAKNNASPASVASKSPSSAQGSPSSTNDHSSPAAESKAAAGDSSSSGDEKQPATLDEKEAKRQRRLIKNRESAQASRERKKSYMHGLEQKCNDLSSQNTSLTNRLLLLEEENYRLREQLKRPDHHEIFQEVEPDSKRLRRTGSQLPKMPLPRNPTATTTTTGGAVSYNPLNPHFWHRVMSAFGAANTVSGPNGVPIVSATGVTAASAQQQNEAGTLSWPQLPAKGIVLFVMLFCVAFLIGTTTRNGAVFNSTNNNFDADSQYEAKRIGRKILELSNVHNIPLGNQQQQQHLHHSKMSQQEFVSKFKELYDQFSEQFGASPNASPLRSVSSDAVDHVIVDPIVDSKKLLLNDAVEDEHFSVHLDKQSNNLVLTIPVVHGKAENITVTQKLLENMCQYLKK